MTLAVCKHLKGKMVKGDIVTVKYNKSYPKINTKNIYT